ncbi:MAG TPA: T9SS type A sorting domain-containing protein [Chitinophagales bacterium]|nr:T9SS type A sorting domain-containing protein [Chitinophagales bacterium]
MKHHAITLLLLLFSSAGMAQEHGAQWFVGPLPSSVLDFRNDTITNYLLTSDIPTTFTTACISDEIGNLLYMSNGLYVTDKYGEHLVNGDSLSPCPYSFQYANIGLNITQAVLFLPKPGDSRYYYLFHYSNDTLNSTRPGTLYYSVIDKQSNFGLGEVVRKNVVFAKGRFREGGMTACKHANGRDWWVIMGKLNSNGFYKFLLTPDTILGPYLQNIGATYSMPYDWAYSKFSQDGSKFATGAVVGYVTVMNFDRCSGEFSNPIQIYNETGTNPSNFSETGCASLEFSPNNQFLYVANRINLTQYDLNAINIQDSVELHFIDSGDLAQLDLLQLGPNGKVYLSCWNGGFYILHVIDRPNEKGDSCNFVFGGLTTLSANTHNIPNLVNYKLGPLLGSGCDTIETDIRDERIDKRLQPRIQPNPADKYMYIEMPMQGNYVFELVNQQGQVVERRETRQVDIINTENLPGGVYFLKVTDIKTTNTSSVQVVVQH